MAFRERIRYTSIFIGTYFLLYKKWMLLFAILVCCKILWDKKSLKSSKLDFILTDYISIKHMILIFTFMGGIFFCIKHELSRHVDLFIIVFNFQLIDSNISNINYQTNWFFPNINPLIGWRQSLARSFKTNWNKFPIIN